ncbi:MAG TPA: GspE/PulE family protein [Bacillota bacterium]|nr:GspE/PulE family protein [Bacillota bacterium]
MAVPKRRKLGEMLLEAGLITPEQLEVLLAEQKSSRRRLGQILVEKGLLSEARLVSLLEEQLHIPQVNLYSRYIDPEVATSIPRNMAELYRVIPFEKDARVLRLAMADPLNLAALDDVAAYTGMEVEPFITAPSAITHVINQYYGLKESLESSTAGRQDRSREAERLQQLKARVEEAPIVKVVNALIERAAGEGASDIHLEPTGEGLRIRLRIDGILHDLMSPPKDTQQLIISRIKIMADMDIAEHRRPQDGNITLKSGPAGNKEINLRVSTMPTIHGEKVVIRLLDKTRIVLPLSKLGFSDQNYRLLRRLLMNPSGMILVTGPTGCGKTTTLYSVLHYLNRPEDNIITIEDPVEYRLDGINQVQVNPRINLTFAGALRFILRQDPNIIMVGEIRDLETARIATQAALTGHLVLSTLHTNNAASAITRLTDMGVEPYFITAALVGVVAQRLIRKICPHCSVPQPLSSEERLLYRHLFAAEPPEALSRGAGCNYCNQSGYRGRTSIQELLVLNREMHGLILAGATAQQLQEKAVAQGMTTLAQSGRLFLEKGITTLDEVVRAVFSSVFDSETASYAPAPYLVGYDGEEKEVD